MIAMWADLIGYAAGILTSISLVPQLIKIQKEKSAKDLSAGMLLIFSSGLFCWFLYGMMINSWPIRITNGFALLISLSILFLKWKYR